MPLSSAQLQCGVCLSETLMQMLLQFNAPGDEGFMFRTIYVFCCINTKCLYADPSKACVLRLTAIRRYSIAAQQDQGLSHATAFQQCLLLPTDRKSGSDLPREKEAA
jgi:hypothetical protein